MPLNITCQRALLCGVMMLQAATVSAQAPAVEPTTDTPSASTEQRIYRGVVGNLLESVPLEPAQRVQLQRANAILSSPLGARSLAVALGIANPPFVIIGLVWGLWSASQIKPMHEPAEQREQASVQESRLFVDESKNVAIRADDDHARKALDAFPLERLSGYATASTLATVVGASATSAPVNPVACETCYLPLLEGRLTPVLR